MHKPGLPHQYLSTPTHSGKEPSVRNFWLRSENPQIGQSCWGLKEKAWRNTAPWRVLSIAHSPHLLSQAWDMPWTSPAPESLRTLHGTALLCTTPLCPPLTCLAQHLLERIRHLSPPGARAWLSGRMLSSVLDSGFPSQHHKMTPPIKT